MLGSLINILSFNDYEKLSLEVEITITILKMKKLRSRGFVEFVRGQTLSMVESGFKPTSA